MPEQSGDGIQSHVNDAEELTKTQRIRALLERRARVIDSLEAISMARTKENKTENETRLIFVSHLRSLIIDLYPLLLQSSMISLDSDESNDESLGEFTVDPPDGVPTEPGHPKLQPAADAPAEQSFDVDSIVWFTERTFPIEVEWTVPYIGKKGNQTVTKDVVPPVPICLAAMKQTMQYMADLKIDIEAHEDKGTFGFDYDEIEGSESPENE